MVMFSLTTYKCWSQRRGAIPSLTTAHIYRKRHNSALSAESLNLQAKSVCLQEEDTLSHTNNFKISPYTFIFYFISHFVQHPNTIKFHGLRKIVHFECEALLIGNRTAF